MSPLPESVRISIFGDDYLVKGDVDIQTTRQVASYVDQKMAEMREKSASTDKRKIAVLSAMNIAGELFDVKLHHEENAKRVSALESRAASLIRKIERSLD